MKIENNPSTKKEQDQHIGYTRDAIMKMTPHPLAPLEDAHVHDGAETLDSITMSRDQIKFETAALASIFIEEAWSHVSDWVRENPAGVGKEAVGFVKPIAVEEFKRKCKDSDPRVVVALIGEYTKDVFMQGVYDWRHSREMDLKNQDSLDPKEKQKLAAYLRYKKILSFGLSNVSNRDHDPVEDVVEHMLGGIGTARNVVLDCLGVLENVFVSKFQRNPTKQEMERLILGAKTLVLSLAQTDVQTFGYIMDSLEYSSQRHLTSANFTIAERGHNLSLEIKKEKLDKMQESLARIPNKMVRTGCPALFAKGENGRNVVSEMYDYFAKLFEEFYLNNNSKFR